MTDYEKKYNEALKRAKELIAKWTGKNKDFYVEDYAYIFPELRESEDERIRKVIFKLLLGMREEIFTSQDEIVTKEKVLAYLEKQKEPENVSASTIIPSCWECEQKEPLTPLAEALSNFLKNDFEFFARKEWNEAKWNEVMNTQAAELQRLAYLEKHKENPKSADSIPADCASSAKCEDRWHKTANSLPDTGRDVLAKDALGNYLLASFDGAQWLVSVYDGQDHPVIHTPAILEWCDIPSEKQKELFELGKGLYYYDGEKTTYCGYPATEDNPYDFAMSQQEKQKEQNPVETSDFKIKLAEYMTKNRTGYSYNISSESILELAKEELIKRGELQKPVEWSEEDKAMIERLIRHVQEEFDELCNDRYGHQEIISDLKESCRERMNWLENRLKSLRPQWKPTEEQMKALNWARCLIFETYTDKHIATEPYHILGELYDKLKQLKDGTDTND